MKFVRTEENIPYGFDIKTLLRRSATAGDVGIEIECEGNKFEKRNSHLGLWDYHKDNSLRGLDNAEYVLRRPIKFSQVPDAVNDIFNIMRDYGTVLDVSNRTSVHVHLNCQNFHMNRLASFFALYFTVEEILTEWCGEHRVGNLFCLRAKDAPGMVRQLKKFIRTDGRYELRDHLHYGGLNAHALYKYGSVEIRTLRGCRNPQTIIDWVAILERIYNLSEEYNDPRGICDLFSAEGPHNFYQTILGPYAEPVFTEIGWTPEQVVESLYEGIRIAQDICFCRDWDLFRPKKLQPDPFGRSSGVVADKIAKVKPVPIPSNGAFSTTPIEDMEQFLNNAAAALALE